MERMETLERRTLLSVNLNFNGGVLTIEGGSGNDNVYVSTGSGSMMVVYDQNVKQAQYALASVKKVIFHGNDGNDQYYYGVPSAVHNLVDGGAGDDNLYTGSGNDTITSGPGRDVLTGNDGNDSLDGGDGDDNLGAGKGNDRLLGGDGKDLLVGGAGDDFFDGGLGADQFRGGEGIDTVSYATRTNAVVADITSISGEQADDGEAGEKDFVEGDNEILIGGAGNDLLVGTTVPPGTNATSTPGYTPNNTLIGNGGNDTLNGLDGNDLLDGGLGSDVFNGGSGIDTADYSKRTQNLMLDLDGVADDGMANENDKIGTDVENLTGGSGADRIIGNASANALKGNAGNDILNGGLGADVFTGGAGADTADYSTRTEKLTLNLDGLANDGAANEKDKIGSDVENLTGGSNADVITGSASANVLRGGAGADQIHGGKGNDIVYGDDGADKIWGDDGNDTLYSRSTPAVKDVIDGGAGTDRAQFDPLDARTSVETALK
jgi:Ca2+-binding RTX toxin-like protein